MEHLLAAKSQDTIVESQDTTAESLKQDELLTYSKETIVNADDLYRESQANGSIGPPPTEERIREIEGWALEVSESVPDVDMDHDQMSFSSGDRTLVGDDNRVKRFRNSIVDVSLQSALAKAALNAAGSSYQKHNFKECMSHLRQRSKLVSTLPEDETIKYNNEESDFRLALALEGLQAGQQTFTISGFSDTQKYLHEAAELIEPLPTDLRDKYKIEEGQVRADLAKLTLRSASRFFADGNFENTEKCFGDFVQLQAPLTTDLLEHLHKEEYSTRMEIAQNALDMAKKEFEGGDISKCFSILRARSDIVNALPEAGKTTSKTKEHQFLQALARETLSWAQNSVEAKDFPTCLRHLELRELILKQLPFEQTDDFDTLRPVCLRAICICSTTSSKGQEEGISVLLKAVEAYESKMPNLTEELQTDLNSLSFLLSQHYLRAADFDEAHHYCSVALTGHRNMLGAAHERASYCHALMARILELRGEHMMAEYHRTLIPKAHLEIPTTKQMLSLEVKSVRFDEPSQQKAIAVEPQSAQQPTKRSSVPSLPHTVVAKDTDKVAKHASQPLLLLHGQQKRAENISSGALSQSVQQSTLGSIVASPSAGKLVASVNISPSPSRRPSSIILHCEFGRVVIMKRITLPGNYKSATDTQKVWER